MHHWTSLECILQYKLFYNNYVNKGLVDHNSSLVKVTGYKHSQASPPKPSHLFKCTIPQGTEAKIEQSEYTDMNTSEVSAKTE